MLKVLQNLSLLRIEKCEPGRNCQFPFSGCAGQVSFRSKECQQTTVPGEHFVSAR